MARRRAKRKTRWIDTMNQVPDIVAGAATPGARLDVLLVSELEVEDSFGGECTIIRTVGEVLLHRDAGSPVADIVFYWSPTYAGAVEPQFVNPDDFDGRYVMYNRRWFVQEGLAESPQTVLNGHFDIRSKRILTENMAYRLSVINQRTTGSDLRVSYHVRTLVMFG